PTAIARDGAAGPHRPARYGEERSGWASCEYEGEGVWWPAAMGIAGGGKRDGRRAAQRPAPAASFRVQAFAHFLAGLEIGDALGIHFHSFAGARIAPDAGVAFPR